MIIRLIIHFPNSSATFETEHKDKISQLSDFCNTELDAYHSTEDQDELTVDVFDEEMSNKFHSLLFELDLL